MLTSTMSDNMNDAREAADMVTSLSSAGSQLGYVSDELRLWFQAINFAVICELINVFGTVTNAMNIVVFVKQGFKDSVNVTLLGLAVSDLGCMVTLIWMNLCFNPLFHDADLPFETMEVQYLTGGWPHVIFTRITSWITAFITVERCLCIALPLKVKSILTSKRVALIMILLFTSLIFSATPVYYANRIGWKFYPGVNKTKLGILYTPDREYIEKVSFAINNVAIPFAAFVTVIASTIILVVKLRGKTEWRQKSAAPGISASLSSRDQRIAQMIVVISVLFIVCFTPVCIIFIAMAAVPEFSITGKFKNMFFIVFSFGFIMESMNSSVNIFIYYYMSSKYRAAFRQMFCMGSGTQFIRK